jgi:hypothetical protein
MDGTDGMLWNDSEEDGKGRSVKKIKALTVKLETVTLIGRGGQNPTCCAH